LERDVLLAIRSLVTSVDRFNKQFYIYYEPELDDDDFDLDWYMAFMDSEMVLDRYLRESTFDDEMRK
jgi:hypothetical protein